MSRRRWDAVVDRVLNSTGITELEFYRRARPTHRVDLARKTAIYLARVELQIPREDVAYLIGLSWRQVCRACAEIEDRRDDPEFNGRLEQLGEEMRALDLPVHVRIAPVAQRVTGATLPFAAQQAA